MKDINLLNLLMFSITLGLVINFDFFKNAPLYNSFLLILFNEVCEMDNNFSPISFTS